MAGYWDNPARAREWPIESLSPWAAAVVEAVERKRGKGESAYCSMFELADLVGGWEGRSTFGPGQVWSEPDLVQVRSRFAHLMEPMRAASALLPEHPGWISLQVTDLLDTGPGLPSLSSREIDRRRQYIRLLGSAERLVRTQFDVEIAQSDDVVWPDGRRPETADEDVAYLLAQSDVRPRTRVELADDIREEATRAYLPAHAVAQLSEAAILVQRGQADPASAALEKVVEYLYDEMTLLGDFRTRIQ
jgi:hypothetical protein